MTLISESTSPPIRPGAPVWWIAELYPDQGSWSEAEYLSLNTNRLVEFDNGTVEILPVATRFHQIFVAFMFKLLDAFFAGKGRVLFAPYRVRIPSRKYREPDVLYMTPEQDARADNQFTDAAELVMEVVSPDEPERDYEKKRADYAEAGVPEYWIVDRDVRQILVLRLDRGAYVEHGKFGPGQRATSHRFPGLEVSVDQLMAEGQ